LIFRHIDQIHAYSNAWPAHTNAYIRHLKKTMNAKT
jgi:hypothetical protein